MACVDAALIQEARLLCQFCLRELHISRILTSMYKKLARQNRHRLFFLYMNTVPLYTLKLLITDSSYMALPSTSNL